jgi:hypothetical protein
MCILSASLVSPYAGSGAPGHLRAAPGGMADFPDHLRAATEGVVDFSAHLRAAPRGMADFPHYLGAAPRGMAGAPDHLGAAPGGVADFPDHRSCPAPPPHISELCPSVTCLPHFELELSTMSGRFTVRLGCSQ